ncbi:PAS domain S-box-containing protein/diguanylate cyclase (GGDEF) domain-containing protein [Duganella sp. OV458]|nr:PAS domain S-box-containing protein/diguanylate cyclase (GGDEF) domain-containing protein [Duganella sp. OV458]SDI72753.1 PAS domain S-box-containing protein/diguanylate cyclase (GGDEF) domain-containing protein [Duganella sp. OV510]
MTFFRTFHAKSDISVQNNLKAIREDSRPMFAALRRLYRAILLPAFGIALLAFMWAAVAYQVRQEKHTAHYEAVLHSQSLARTLAEHTNHLLRQVDHATQLFKLKYEESDGRLRLPEFTRRNGLLDSLLPTKLDLPLAVLDREGNIIESMNGYFAPNLKHHPIFRKHAGSSDDTALVATPVVDSRTKKWQIQISRRLNNPAGGFAGVIMVMIDPAYFVEDYDRLTVDAGGAVMLISRENGMSAARIDDQVIISDSIDFSVAQSSPTQPPEEFLLKRRFDAIDRIYGYAEMPRFQLMAVVGNPAESQMARFEHRRDMYYIATTVASVLVLLFVYLLVQQAHRLRRTASMVIEAQLMLRAAADASLDAVFLFKACRMRGARREILDFTIADLNERGAQLLGYRSADIKGKRLVEVVPELHSKGFVEKYRHVLEARQPLEEEFEVDFLPNREVHWLHHQIVPITDGVAVNVRDITSRMETELAARKQQAELTAVNDASPLGLLRADATGHCTYVNRTFELITGLTREEALGDAWLRAVHPQDRAVLKNALAHMAQTRVPYQDTLRCVHPDGMIVWVSFKIAAMVVDGKIYGYVGTVDDITHVRKSVMALRESESRLRTIADTLPAMVAYIDAGQVYRFHNVAYEREFNRSGTSVLGRTIRDTMGEERYAFLEAYVERALQGETLTFEEEDTSDSSNLAERTYEVVYIPQLDEDGANVIGFHVMRQDITVQKREKQRLLRLSQVDALTGLTNRAGFLQKLHDAMIATRANGNLMAVMYMDIDRFKPVNDTFGHAVGDALLKAFSARLTHTMRASDTIARLGGDEFTIIMERIHRVDDAAALAAKIVAAMQADFDLDGTVVSISTSIGLTFYSEEDVSPAELLNRADILLYEAKQAGRNTFRAGQMQHAPASNVA